MSRLSHAEQTIRLVRGGASFIQLRDKRASAREFYAGALAAIDAAEGARILINDRVDIAMAVKAGGVHLGQDDMPPGKARALLGDAAIIGFSTHTIDQVKAAAALPIDYIAFGPVFDTTTKADPDATVGIEGLKRARDAAGDRQFVAIGGIDRTNINEVFAAGVDSVAIIGGLISARVDIPEMLKCLHSLAPPPC